MQRIESIDILKGIGIILMIVAHTYGPNYMIWDFIYAFHMPLFFIVAGYFYKQRLFSETLKRNCNQIFIQYIALCLIIIILTQIRQPHNFQTDIKSTLYGMGPGWFLLAMFMVRLEFHYILNIFPNQHLIISLFISIGVCLTTHYHDISSFLSIFPSLAGLFFLSAGYYIKQHYILDYINKHSFNIILIAFLLWLITSLHGKVELSQCIFKLSIIDFAGSLGGTLLFFKISQLIDKHGHFLKNVLSYAGKYSIIILFFHCIDYCVPFWYPIEPYLPSSLLIPAILIIRFLFVTICVISTLRIKWLRFFFRIQ